MRVTFKEVNESMQFNIMKNFDKLSKLQEQIATGRRLNRPSDDPVDVTNDLALRASIMALNQYKRNINDGIAFMSVTDTSLVSMNDLMQRVKELGIQASNDTYTAEQRDYINRELSQLLRQLISLINTTYKGEYVFGGTNNKTAPYTVEEGTYSGTIDNVGFPVGTVQPIWDTSVVPNITSIRDILPGSVTVTSGAVTYKENVDYFIDYVNGTFRRVAGGAMDGLADGTTFEISFEWVKKAAADNTNAIYREIEENVTPRINLSSDDLCIDAANNANLIDDMIAMGQYLIQNNAPSLRTAMTGINYVFENILSMQSINGSRINRFELTKERNEGQIVEITRLQSELEDADLAQVITEFSLLENIYSASLKAGAHIIQPSLVDFLG